jgi:hypothetical protein
MSNTNCNIVFIKKQYFIDNNSFIEMLDTYDKEKQLRRKYMFRNIQYNENNIFIPLRSEINLNYGNIGYPIPSENKPNAGLDFRKMLIINDLEYIEFPKHNKIPNSQEKIIINNYKTIENNVINYIKKYVKSAIKNREKIDSLFKFSTLHNYHKELEINKLKKAILETQQQVAPTKE